MKPWHFIFFVLAIVAAPAYVVSAFATNAEPDNTWSGVWQDGSGDTMSIQQSGAYLDVSGKDDLSIYTALCLIQKSLLAAKCSGSGIQVTTGKRFLYQTQWQLDGDTISEKWTAEFKDEILKGELSFSRQKVAD